MNMLDKLLKPFHFNHPKGGADLPKVIQPVRLLEIMQELPIGTKVQYRPEYRDDISMNSIILAYGINDHLIYSNNDIRDWQDGSGVSLVIGNGGNEELINQIESFCFIIPANEAEQQQLDYTRKAEIGSGGQFRRGNSIMLMSHTSDRGIPTIDTTVRKTICLKEGYYAKHDVVVLDVVMDSFEITDKRHHYRLKVNLPISIKMSEDELPYPCTLDEFSENSVYISFPDDEPFVEQLTEGKIVYFTVDLRQRHKKYMLRGVVQKRKPDAAIIDLNGIYGDNVYRELQLLDALDIKASLLQHPETRQVKEEIK